MTTPTISGFFCSLSSSTTALHQRVMVRTCNGLELRDSGGLYGAQSDQDLQDTFPSTGSRDELTPR